MLTGRYLNGVPEGSRAAAGTSFDADWLTDEAVERLRGLNAIAERRGQSLAQLALAVGAARPARHLPGHRRQQRRPARAERRRARQPGVLGGRARGDRRARDRRGRRPVGRRTTRGAVAGRFTTTRARR
ncbi:hypothetical protein ACU4GD_45420 [Cupriavidus basilensis]